nr:hypothetical protein [Tanacetum cinerariifolium]
MSLLNGICITCIYGDGKPLTCSVCEGMLKGGTCLPCNLKAKKLFIRDQNAYSFNDTSNNSNYIPQPQCENYLCNLCGNNSHDGYDCQQQFSYVYEQEPSYNQNYNDNYYPHESPSFPCCDNCGGSHETFQCQPIDQNIDFSGSDQIQTPHYPKIHPFSQEINEEVFQAKGDLMKSIQTFLEEFNCIPFEKNQRSYCKLDLKELAEYVNSPSKDRSNFFKNNKEHYVQYEESLENSSNEIVASNSNQEKEKPQYFDICQLIREECCIEVCEEQKQKMENTIIELVEICRQKELYCMHDNVDDLIESALSSKLLSINLNSQRLDKKKQEVKKIVEQPAEHRTQEPKHSLSMGYEHLSTTPKTESDEVTESSSKNLLPIPSECKVTLENESGYDMPAKDDFSPAFTTFSNPLFNDNDDLDSSDDESLPDEDVSTEEFKIYLNPLFVDDEINSDKLEPHCFNVESDFVESLLNHDTFIDSSPKFDFLLKEFSGELTHINLETKEADFDFEEEIRLIENLLNDNSSPRPPKELNTEIVDTIVESIPSSFIPVQDNDSQREEIKITTDTDELLPLDAEFDFEPKEISVVMNNIDELNEDECFDSRGDIDVFKNVEDDDYFPFIFVIRSFLPYLIYPEHRLMAVLLSSAVHVVLTTRPACRPSLVSCLSSLGESPLFVTVAHGQSLGVLPSLSAASESGSHVTAAVSGSVYSATVAVPGVSEVGTHMHILTRGGSKAHDVLSGLTLPIEPKPLG